MKKTVKKMANSDKTIKRVRDIVTLLVLGSLLGIIVFAILYLTTWSTGFLWAMVLCAVFLIGFYVRDIDYRWGTRNGGYYDD